MMVELDWANEKDVRAAADLHKKLLSDSLIPQLGNIFMTKFYYRDLIKDGLIKCNLYRQNDDYVAFAVYTEYPFTFMAEGKRRHFLRLCLILSLSIIAKPIRLMTIINALKVDNKRGSEGSTDNAGEMLSFGVLDSCRDIRDESTGLRIVNILFDSAISYFRSKGFKKMYGEIRKSNLPSLLLWKSYGAVPEEVSCSQEGSAIFGVPL